MQSGADNSLFRPFSPSLFYNQQQTSGFDSAGNIEFFGGHFSNSPLAGLVPLMFWTITVLESLAGVLSGIGALMILLGMGTDIAVWGLTLSSVSLLCPVLRPTLSQRLCRRCGDRRILCRGAAGLCHPFHRRRMMF